MTLMNTKLTKLIMSSLAFACALVCLAAAMALSTGTSATAGPAPDMALGTDTSATAEPAPDSHHGCHVGMLRGLYLWTFDGYQNVGGSFVPKAIMQGLQFNGDGTTFNPFGTVNIGGTIIIDATGGVGTYTVAADCTGTLSITGGPSFSMYVGPGGKLLWITQTNVGTFDGTGLGVGTATLLPQ